MLRRTAPRMLSATRPAFFTENLFRYKDHPYLRSSGMHHGTTWIGIPPFLSNGFWIGCCFAFVLIMYEKTLGGLSTRNHLHNVYVSFTAIR